MHFKHPELLYALLLLVIPVLVHLFQLRKFRKEKFTNVKFLKKAVLQTRKSSRIKKWLILCTRLLLLASVILAFAQPYIPAVEEMPAARETVIYLDNSYSMQARGQNGILLRRGIQELLENLPQDTEFSFFTNSSEYPSTTLNGLRNDLQQLTYSPEQPDWTTIRLKAENYFSESPDVRKNFIAISDFQFEIPSEEIAAPEGTNFSLVRFTPQNLNNVSLDTAFISSQNLDELTLELRLSATGNPSDNIPVSVYKRDTLLAKKSIQSDDELQAVFHFTFPAEPIRNGRISIEDAGLSFDNELFFSINETSPVKVVAIGSENSSYLQGIFKSPEFELQVFDPSEVDYNSLSLANLIVLNELEEIPLYLATNVNSLIAEDVYFVVVPAEDADVSNYNSFFRETGLPAFKGKIEQERLITDISYEHPLYENVFDEQVRNFQYPMVRSYFDHGSTGLPVLSMENGQAFLYQQNNFFVFSAAINSKNSNFKSAPLIVPTFYNIGNLALSPSRLYYDLGKENKIDVSINLGKDEILQLQSSQSSFIPRQRSFQNKVELVMDEDPETPGNYNVTKGNEVLTTVSFNISRTESRRNYNEPRAGERVSVHNEIPEVFRKLEADNEETDLWKWFVIFAFVLLLTEMLILKYFK